MIVTSNKTLTEAYWDMVNQSLSDGLMPASNHIAEQVELPVKDLTSGTPCTRPSVNLSEAIYYHVRVLMEKLTYKSIAWLHKCAD